MEQPMSAPLEKLSDGVGTFLSIYCPYSQVIIAFGSFALLFLLVSVGSFLVIPPDRPGHTIALMTIVLDGVIVVVLSGILVACRRRMTGTT